MSLRDPRGYRKLLAQVCVIAALVASPAISFAQGGAPQSNVLVGGFDVGPGGFPGKFNPLTATAGFTWFNMYFETLVLYDASLTRLQGALAKSWKVSADGTTYTFSLEPNVRWQDGTPLTSADVKFSLELAQSPETASIFASRLSGIKRISTPDAHTVTVEFGTANASFLDVLTKLMIFPQHLLSTVPPAKLATSDWWHTSPIGTGPFQFVKYVPDQNVELRAFGGYWRGAPKLGGVIDRYFQTTASAVAALKAGAIEFTYAEPDDVQTFQNDPNYRVIAGSSYVVNYLGFNTAAPMFKDVRVRQAFMYAIDRAAIIKSLYGGAAQPANCPYTAPAYVPGGLNPYSYDPQKARQLLAAAGWPALNGAKPITVLTYYNSQQVANVLSAMQSMLAQLGVNIAPRQVDVPTYNATVYASTPDWTRFPIVFAGLQNGPDPYNISVGMSASAYPPAGANFLHINIPELTALFSKASTETEYAQRVKTYQAVCSTVNRDVPWATMWVARRYGVVSRRVEHFVWTPSPGGGAYYAAPQLWSLSK